MLHPPETGVASVLDPALATVLVLDRDVKGALADAVQKMVSRSSDSHGSDPVQHSRISWFQ